MHVTTNQSPARAKGRVVAAAFAAIVATSLLTACGGGGSAASPGGATPVTFAVGSPTLTDSTAPYGAVPQQLGYWKDQGLDVTVQPTQGATASMQLLVAGKADIANGGASAFYQAAEKNPEIRVIQLQEANIWQTVVPEGSPIKSLSDLKGKTIGTQSLSSSSYLYGRAAITAVGLDPDKDVQWLPVGVGSQAAQAFKSSQIAAYATYDGPSGVVGTVLGQKLINLPTPLDKVPGSLGIATTEKFLTDHADTVTKFLAGIVKGAIFAAENPAAALQLQWVVHPDQKPRDISTEQAIQQTLPVVETRFKGGAVPGPDGVIGVLPVGDIQQGIDFMLKNDIIKSSLQADKVADLSLNKKAADMVDAAAIRKQAQNWKP